MAVLGVSDPRQWSAADWLNDLIPHLISGAVTYARWPPWTAVRKSDMTTTTAMLKTYPKPIDLLMGAPAEISEDRLKELHLSIRKPGPKR